MWDPRVRVDCGGCVNGFIRRDDKAVPHMDCEGTGQRIPKNWGRPVKAHSRIGQPSPWVKKAKLAKRK